jgi:hypothetical protein
MSVNYQIINSCPDYAGIADDYVEVGRFTRTVQACLAIVPNDGGLTGLRINVIVGRPTSSIFNFKLALVFDLYGFCTLIAITFVSNGYQSAC